ncbi:unnamed protein product [Mytilus coruscus]|uniref:Uncharacterized protein n=1 Tax=Mytilus coruscus TaxID=42192 RepID=A0A6J8CGI6_MYTCO|nr:unnamed protein product [Mytilus coruscus]
MLYKTADIYKRYTVFDLQRKDPWFSAAEFSTTLTNVQEKVTTFDPTNFSKAIFWLNLGVRVGGIRNLRVVEASVMRNQIASYPHAVAIMIAEKAADMIRCTNTVGKWRRQVSALYNTVYCRNRYADYQCKFNRYNTVYCRNRYVDYQCKFNRYNIVYCRNRYVDYQCKFNRYNTVYCRNRYVDYQCKFNRYNIVYCRNRYVDYQCIFNRYNTYLKIGGVNICENLRGQS